MKRNEGENGNSIQASNLLLLRTLIVVLANLLVGLNVVRTVTTTLGGSEVVTVSGSDTTTGMISPASSWCAIQDEHYSNNVLLNAMGNPLNLLECIPVVPWHPNEQLLSNVYSRYEFIKSQSSNSLHLCSNQWNGTWLVDCKSTERHNNIIRWNGPAIFNTIFSL